jgi:hypothetical protein
MNRTTLQARQPRSLLAGCVLLAAACQPTFARAEEPPDKSFEIYGFAQADYIQDFNGRLEPEWDDALRPSKICLDDTCGSDGQSSISVKQSRFGVKGRMPTGSTGTPLEFKFEFDLFGTGVDAGQTTFHLRQAYGEWGPITIGKVDSVFMDAATFPNTIDFWGPPGMPFFRNVQFRWTPYRTEHGEFAIAIEEPNNDIDPGNIRLIDGLEDLQVQPDEEVPDLTAHYRLSGDWGHVHLGGILRKVGYEVRANDTDPWIDGSEAGWGINVGVVFNVLAQNKILLGVVHGEGIASYMNDGGMDLAPDATFVEGVVTDVEAQAVPLTGMSAYYDHYWNERWSSSIGYSYTEVDNTNLQDPETFQKGEYASTNLLYYPADNLMFGVEVLWGKLTVNDGGSDDVLRLQFSARYTFGTRL